MLFCFYCCRAAGKSRSTTKLAPAETTPWSKIQTRRWRWTSPPSPSAALAKSLSRRRHPRWWRSGANAAGRVGRPRVSRRPHFCRLRDLRLFRLQSDANDGVGIGPRRPRVMFSMNEDVWSKFANPDCSCEGYCGKRPRLRVLITPDESLEYQQGTSPLVASSFPEISRSSHRLPSAGRCTQSEVASEAPSTLGPFLIESLSDEDSASDCCEFRLFSAIVLGWPAIHVFFSLKFFAIELR